MGLERAMLGRGVGVGEVERSLGGERAGGPPEWLAPGRSASARGAAPLGPTRLAGAMSAPLPSAGSAHPLLPIAPAANSDGLAARLGSGALPKPYQGSTHPTWPLGDAPQGAPGWPHEASNPTKGLPHHTKMPQGGLPDERPPWLLQAHQSDREPYQGFYQSGSPMEGLHEGPHDQLPPWLHQARQAEQEPYQGFHTPSSPPTGPSPEASASLHRLLPSLVNTRAQAPLDEPLPWLQQAHASANPQDPSPSFHRPASAPGAGPQEGLSRRKDTSADEALVRRDGSFPGGRVSLGPLRRPRPAPALSGTREDEDGFGDQEGFDDQEEREEDNEEGDEEDEEEEK